jgi:hypothetical protein
MGHVETGDIHALQGQGLEHFIGLGSGSNGADNFCFTHCLHVTDG